MLTGLLLVISCRYDIKSTETVFDNATRSRIVSLETIISYFYVMRDLLYMFCILA